jgi:hypothetical protein
MKNTISASMKVHWAGLCPGQLPSASSVKRILKEHQYSLAVMFLAKEQRDPAGF